MPSSNAKQILADNVRRLRLSAGLSQEELAARADLHRTYISSIERARRNVTLGNIFVLADALGTTPATLVTPAEDSEAG